MGNHGGGIPKGSKNRPGQKGTSQKSADKPKVGDHVRVHAGLHTGVEGKVRRMVGANHVHIVPKAGRAVIAHVKNVGSVGVQTKHVHARVGVK